MDNNIIYYVAGFIARSLKKTVKCKECSNILGNNEEISMPTVADITDDCDQFLNTINWRGLIKSSDIIFISCIASRKVVRSIMDNDDCKSYLLACKYQRPVFVKCLLTHIKDTYSGILATTCTKLHTFGTIINRVAENLVDVMVKYFASQVNSTTHANKKRKAIQVTSTNVKIRKLQSDKSYSCFKLHILLYFKFVWKQTRKYVTDSLYMEVLLQYDHMEISPQASET